MDGFVLALFGGYVLYTVLNALVLSNYTIVSHRCEDYKTQLAQNVVTADVVALNMMAGHSPSEDCGAAPPYAHCSSSTIHAMLSKKSGDYHKACPQEWENWQLKIWNELKNLEKSSQ